MSKLVKAKELAARLNLSYRDALGILKNNPQYATKYKSSIYATEVTLNQISQGLDDGTIRIDKNLKIICIPKSKAISGKLFIPNISKIDLKNKNINDYFIERN